MKLARSTSNTALSNEILAQSRPSEPAYIATAADMHKPKPKQQDRGVLDNLISSLKTGDVLRKRAKERKSVVPLSAVDDELDASKMLAQLMNQ
jgi:hypothetical protein